MTEDQIKAVFEVGELNASERLSYFLGILNPAVSRMDQEDSVTEKLHKIGVFLGDFMALLNTPNDERRREAAPIELETVREKLKSFKEIIRQRQGATYKPGVHGERSAWEFKAFADIIEMCCKNTRAPLTKSLSH